MKKLLMLLGGALFLLVGSSGPLDTRIDASTPEAYQRSLQAIRAKLQPDELKKFEDALIVVAFNEIIPKDSGLLGILAAAGNPENCKDKCLQWLTARRPEK